MFQIDPTTLNDTRLQLHWSAQLLAAAADAMVEKSADDSHSNLAWDEANRAMEGRIGARIEFPTMKIVTASGDEFSLLGKTLDEARIWLDEELEAELVMRDYEMPAHSVADGAPFESPQEQRDELATWFTFGQQSMGPDRWLSYLAAPFRSRVVNRNRRSKQKHRWRNVSWRSKFRPTLFLHQSLWN